LGTESLHKWVAISPQPQIPNPLLMGQLTWPPTPFKSNKNGPPKAQNFPPFFGEEAIFPIPQWLKKS